jgi:diguanylate cyclase (GGDEF)-like protein/PAS domain S-box-containing protein
VDAEAIPAGVLACDATGRVRAANRYAEELLGYDEGELVGREVEDLVPDRLRADHGALREAFVGTPQIRAMGQGRDLVALCKDGTEIEVEISLGHALDESGALLVHALLVDISRRRAAEEQLAHQSLHDSLTGLPNRTLLVERIEQALIATTREPRTRVVVAFIDLDQFELLNDSLGHEVGDEVLCAVADRLRAALPPSETLGRIGDDEFVVVSGGIAVEGDAAALAARIERALEEPLPISTGVHPTSASIGMALSGPDAADPHTLLRNAGSAMHRAKAHGRARFEIFDTAMHERSVRALALSRALAMAPQRDELSLVYQPIFSLADRRLEGFEALLRWAHDGKAVSPAEFIPLAERSGSVVALGHWVLRNAARQLAIWQRRWPDVHVAINLSARQIAEPDLVSGVVAALERSGARPEGLTFEVTETTVLADPQEAIEVLGALRTLGCRLLLDDFGTGFSSLEHVARFAVDGLKIDRSFVARCEHDAAARAVVDAVVGLAGGLGCDVVAEGVETAGQHDLVQEAGCAYGQGYLFGAGMPAAGAEQLLGRREAA